jgi:hypothetical protein
MELPGIVVARPPEVGEANGPPVDLVEARQDLDGVAPQRPPLRGRETRQGELGQDPARHVAHHVEDGAHDLGILAEDESLGHRHVCRSEGGDHPELPLHGVR